MKKGIAVVLLVILFGTCIRALNLTQPLLEGASVRQIQTAMIARNYYDHGFKLFYPQIDGPDEQPVYFAQEFYFIPFLAALAHKFTKAPIDWILRAISLIFFILASGMLYNLTRRLFSLKSAIFSVICFTLSPLSIYLGRSVHPEMAIIFFNIALIYYFLQWLESKKAFHGMMAAVSFIMTALLKIPDLYMLLPLVFAGMFYGKRDLLKDIQFWIILIFCSAVIVAFNLHQNYLRTIYPNPVMENFKLDTILHNIRVFLAHKEFYKKVYDDFATYTLTPIGLTLFSVGLFLRQGMKIKYIFHVWIAAVVVFFLIMPAQSMQGYYQAHFLPPCCIIIAVLLDKCLQSRFFKDCFFQKARFKALAAILICLVVARYAYAYYKVPAQMKNVVEAGRAIDKLVEKDALVICSISNDPALLYYSNRKGWIFSVDIAAKKSCDIEWGEEVGNKVYDPVIILEDLRSRKARYFASAAPSEFYANKEFSSYMFDNYSVLKQTGNYIIFNLEKNKAQR